MSDRRYTVRDRIKFRVRLSRLADIIPGRMISSDAKSLRRYADERCEESVRGTGPPLHRFGVMRRRGN
jgi:hypothetical protein